MTNQELMDLRQSNDAPYNHQDYTIWLHDQIVAKIKCEIQHLSEHAEPEQVRQSILYLPSLKKAE